MLKSKSHMYTSLFLFILPVKISHYICLNLTLHMLKHMLKSKSHMYTSLFLFFLPVKISHYICLNQNLTCTHPYFFSFSQSRSHIIKISHVHILISFLSPSQDLTLHMFKSKSPMYTSLFLFFLPVKISHVHMFKSKSHMYTSLFLFFLPVKISHVHMFKSKSHMYTCLNQDSPQESSHT